ncbi:hypothetical protein VP01_1549g4 [Puccinia sorghi]|uniref:Uncharacterized protein n=1 Tax=Puccinia sorghi TaxID=27349 RepID=A0A0L6VI92_9BASI|nr:hypothetical protein VP01_1549g4 [Puccinia sorghi]
MHKYSPILHSNGSTNRRLKTLPSVRKLMSRLLAPGLGKNLQVGQHWSLPPTPVTSTSSPKGDLKPPIVATLNKQLPCFGLRGRSKQDIEGSVSPDFVVKGVSLIVESSLFVLALVNYIYSTDRDKGLAMDLDYILSFAMSMHRSEDMILSAKDIYPGNQSLWALVCMAEALSKFKILMNMVRCASRDQPQLGIEFYKLLSNSQTASYLTYFTK